jgi:predicted protein tyrosine phosphatase
MFLSNIGVASSRAVLKNMMITHVVNCTVDSPFATDEGVDDISPEILLAIFNGELGIDALKTKRSSHDEIIIEKLRVPVVDESDQRISDHFDKAIAFINQALNSNMEHRVLVHCKHGQSRSATVLAAWLVHSGYTVSDALGHLKACRPKVGPNEGFVEQLRVFESKQAKESATDVVTLSGAGAYPIGSLGAVETKEN